MTAFPHALTALQCATLGRANAVSGPVPTLLENLTGYPNGINVGTAENPVAIFSGDGAPTDGVTGVGFAGPGSLYTDFTGGGTYQNTNDIDSPTWTLVPPGGATLDQITVHNGTGGPLTRDTLVTISGFDAGSGNVQVVKADANNSLPAQYVLQEDIADGDDGHAAARTLSAATLNTNSFTSVGDPAYLSETAGGFTNTAPTAANSTKQVVGVVVVKSAGVGQILWDVAPARKIGTNEIEDGAILNAQVGAAAAIVRTKLAVDASQKYPLNIMSDVGAALGSTEATGTFNRSVSTNVILIQGEISDNETEVSVGYAQFVLPAEYVGGVDVVLRLPVKLVKTGSAVDNGSTIDVEAYEQSEAAGTVGADLCATVAATFAAVDTWYNKDFTITGAGLLPGDTVNFKLTSSIIDSEAGAGTLRLNMLQPRLLIGVQG